MRRSILTILLCCLALSSAFAETSLPKVRRWKVDGVAREAILCVPTRATKTRTPVIFAFHGYGGTAKNAVRQFGYQRLWPKAVVVYMEGLPLPGVRKAPKGGNHGWQSRAGSQNDRDVKFFDTVLASLKKEYRVDTKRIFAMGHSNGGSFTYLLWAMRGDTFAAIAPASAVAAGGMPRLKPKPVIQVAGEKDRLVPYSQQQRMMAAIRRFNGCDAVGKPWARSGSLTGTLYSSKTGPPFVSLLYPGGHNFPKEAPALIVRFFKEQTDESANPLDRERADDQL